MAFQSISRLGELSDVVREGSFPLLAMRMYSTCLPEGQFCGKRRVHTIV
jgi:hypothetical protein